MVHCFTYPYRGREIHFLWDVESGSLHNVDRAAYLTAKARYAALTTAETAEAECLAPQERKEIAAEFEEMERAGAIDTPALTHVGNKRYGELKALCLHICHDCNLRCAYCFAGEGNYRSERCMMSAEVGKKAIDFLIARSGAKKNLEVDFFGGEPLMNLGVVKEIVAYARARESDADKLFSFTMTTNCVLLNEDTARWLNEEMSNVVLSIDGRPEIHNAVRKTVNGKDCYDTIVDNALRFVKMRGERNHYVRGTFTARNLDFDRDILYLRDAGFQQISVEPVVLDQTHPLAIKEEHLPQIYAAYERLAEQFIEARANGKWFNFFHFMLDLDQGPCIKKRLSGCGSGCEYLSVTPEGDLYPCHQFAGEAPYKIGNILNGEILDTIMCAFSENVVTKKSECAECPAKYYCSGGCAANNLHFTGSIHTPYTISCAMMKKRFELSLAIAAIERSAAEEKF